MNFYGSPAVEQVNAKRQRGGLQQLVALASLVSSLALGAAILVTSPAGAQQKIGESSTPASSAVPAVAAVAAKARSVPSIASQALGWYTRYTLHLDIGGEQSVDVIAPPGGLQFDVRDMTGDKVPNDVIVAPALLHWPLTVLVNDGNNHFTVAISAKPADPLASGQKKASGAPQSTHLAAFLSPRSEHQAASNRVGALVPVPHEEPLASVRAVVTPLHTIASSSGRAPPVFPTTV